MAFSTGCKTAEGAEELACLLQQHCSSSKLALLNMLLIHWRKVVANEPTNKMNAQTMATCCFMAVFTAAGETEDQAEMMKHFKRCQDGSYVGVIKLLIESSVDLCPASSAQKQPSASDLMQKGAASLKAKSKKKKKAVKPKAKASHVSSTPAAPRIPQVEERRYDGAEGPFTYAEFAEYYDEWDCTPQKWAAGIPVRVVAAPDMSTGGPVFGCTVPVACARSGGSKSLTVD